MTCFLFTDGRRRLIGLLCLARHGHLSNSDKTGYPYAAHRPSSLRTIWFHFWDGKILLQSCRSFLLHAFDLRAQVGFGIWHWCTSETPVKWSHRTTGEISVHRCTIFWKNLGIFSKNCVILVSELPKMPEVFIKCLILNRIQVFKCKGSLFWSTNIFNWRGDSHFYARFEQAD